MRGAEALEKMPRWHAANKHCKDKTSGCFESDPKSIAPSIDHKWEENSDEMRADKLAKTQS